VGIGMEANADDRESGRDGGSIDIVRESVLARIKLGLLKGKSYGCEVGTGVDTESERVEVGWLNIVG
jgi:hypothetical protein